MCITVRPMIQNIIFDMGNVLLRFDPEIPLHAFLDNDADRSIIRTELFHSREWAMGDEGLLTNAERYEPVSRRVPSRLHPALKRCVDEWNVCMQPMPGARAFFSAVKAKGYRVYVLSNADNTFYDYFERFAPLSEFDGVTVSADIRMIKPNPDIYQYFLTHYKLTADECLFIDDRAENIAAAEAFGIHGFVFTGDFDAVKAQYRL